MNFRDFYSGNAFDAYEFFGAHIEGDGVWFRVYAPKAKAVYVTGEFSEWEKKQMEHGFDPGVYTLYVPQAKEGMLYKYSILGADDITVLKADPYAQRVEPEGSASVVWESEHPGTGFRVVSYRHITKRSPWNA